MSSNRALSLPERSTRGKRLHAAIDEEDAADKDFWNQEFFAEEAVDEDYQQESEEEDVIDSDFDLPEEDEDDDEVVEVKEKPRRKVLKAPEPKMHRQKPAAKAADETGGDQIRSTTERAESVEAHYEAPTLRRSTISRIAQAQRERERQEQMKPRRKVVKDQEQWRPLTQQELLAEAARTEIENMQSLQQLLALEEETKRKAQIVKKQHLGPIVKYLSKKEGEASKVYFELVNMHQPPTWLRPAHAPAPIEQSVCVITGLPAAYLEPRTGQPFASVAAYKQIREVAFEQAAVEDLQRQPSAPQLALGAPGTSAIGHTTAPPELAAMSAPNLPFAAGSSFPPTAINRGLVGGVVRAKGLRSQRCRPNPGIPQLGAHMMRPPSPRSQQHSLVDVSPDIMALMVDFHNTINPTRTLAMV